MWEVAHRQLKSSNSERNNFSLCRNFASLVVGLLKIFMSIETESRSWLAAAMIRPCITVGWVAGIFTIMGAFADWHWVCDLLINVRIQLAVGLSVACTMLLLFRQWKHALVFAGLLAWNVTSLAPLWINGANSQANEANTPHLKIISVNVLSNNHSASSLRSYLRREEADLVIVLEVDHFWEREFKSLADIYPHQLARARNDNFGIALLSRTPLLENDIVKLTDAGVPTVIARTSYDQRELTVIGTHPLPPVGSRGAKLRNEQLEALSRRVSKLSEPVIIAGDLNVTPWSPYFQRFLTQTNMIDARRGFGLQCSWPTSIWPLSIPIDHILVSRHFHVDHFAAGPNVGSDHRPVVTEVSLVKQRGALSTR